MQSKIFSDLYFFLSGRLFFSKKNNDTKKIYDLIVDDLDHEHSIKNF